MPETGLSGLEGGARFKPSSLPLSIRFGRAADASASRPYHVYEEFCLTPPEWIGRIFMAGWKRMRI